MSDKRTGGRPPLYETAASQRIVVRVTPAQRLELRRVADQQGTGMAGVIRELIDERVEDRRPFPGHRHDEEEEEDD
jgi:hypothetical protein